MGLKEVLPKVLRLEVPSPLEEMPPSVCYILLGEGVTLCIDPGYPLPQVEEALREALPRKNSKVWVLLTHGHVDHYGAAGFLQKEYGARVLVHPKDLPKVAQGVVKELEGRRKEVLKHWRLIGLGDEVEALWTELDTFRRMYTGTIQTHPLPPELSLGGWTLKTVPTPGHTAGSCSLYVEGKGWLFSGDTLMPSGLETWLSGPVFGEEGAGLGEYLQGLKRIEALAPRWVLPGHGEPFRRFGARLQEVRQRCKRHKEDILAALRDEETTAWQIAKRLFDPKGFVGLLATGQVFALLEVLRAQGKVTARQHGPILWRRTR